MNAATVFGGGAVRKDLPGLLRIVLGITVLLVAFSRIYLGVHCPQDILVGAAAGILVMWLTAKLMQWVAGRPEKDILVLCVGIGLAIAVAIYAAVKPYPADYDAEGRLLVDGVKMANDTIYGLSNSIFTRDRYHGMLLAQKLQSGMVHINDQSIGDEPHVMFGGEKQSGLGRFNGSWVLNKFTTEQWIPVR